MAYKDKDKQRQASKEAMKRYRDRRGEMCKKAGVIDVVPDAVIPSDVIPSVIPEQGDWWCSQSFKYLVHTLNTWTVAELEAKGYWIPCWKLNTDQTYEQVHQAIAGIELPE